MKTWGKVSSIPVANTLFEGQHINGETQYYKITITKMFVILSKVKPVIESTV
jgi:hypothetical protein